MSDSQKRALQILLDGPHTTIEVARRLDTTIPVAQRTLDALYRRSWVLITDSGRYCTSERGRRKVS
jgi:Mn-dependent DtxR family transcriptional regulator